MAIGFDDLLVRGATGVLGLAVAWAAAIVLAIGVEALTDGRVALAPRLGCPQAVRAGLLALVPVLLIGGPAASAREAADPPPRSLDGLAVPTRTADPGAEDAVSRAQSGPSVSSTVRVRPGDSLWRIARRVLPAEEPDTTVADAVRALHALNRATVGADPDRLRPGQILELPRDLTSTARITYSEEP